MDDCIFCKIINGDIPTTKVFEDDLCLAFRDIAPLAPEHFLVIPKVHIASAEEINDDNAFVVGHIYSIISKLSKDFGYSNGFRVVTNCGTDAGQTVHHLHFHVLAGKVLGSFN